jgi:hypothetical protein
MASVMHRDKPGTTASVTSNDEIRTPAPLALNAEVRSQIGASLRTLYDHVGTEGVPERFVELLKRLDKGSK